MKTDYSPLKQYHYLYKITNLINDKIYIGIHSTDNLDDDYFGSGVKLKLAIKKYGKENFKKEILEWFDWRIEALQRESEVVNEEFVKRHKTYNIDIGGNGGSSHTIETRLKISKNNWVKQNGSPMKGKVHSEETKKKMKTSYKYVKREKTKDECEHHSFVMKGKVHSEETKKKMSLSQKGKRVGPYSDEKRKLFETYWNKMKGLKINEETKKKMSLAQKGKPWSEKRRTAYNITRGENEADGNKKS